MQSKRHAHRTFAVALALATVLLVIIILGRTELWAVSGLGLFQSPLSIPLFDSPLPFPTPSVPSEAAQRARAYVAECEGVPVEMLTIIADHPTSYSALERELQVVTLLDTQSKGRIYKLLVDLDSGQIEEDISALMTAEAQAHQGRYGKMEKALFQRLQMLEDDDLLSVAVWMAAQPERALADQQYVVFATLAAKYPEVQAALETMGKPMDVDDPKLAGRIYAEYNELLDAEASIRTQPLITELEHQGFAITAYEGIPSFAATLPKSVILELSQRENVSSISLVEVTKQPDMDSAALTVLAPVVWGRGYSGSDVTIGILDIGNVDPNNTFLHLSPTYRPGIQGIFDHATETASAAASFHGTYKGIAPDATILSVGEDASQADEILALQWAFDEGAQILNNSGGFEEDLDIHWTDRAFDYWTRERSRLVVKSSGNNDGGQHHLTSPGKAWNVLTVGGIEDNNTATWSDDQMWADSSYVNPSSLNSDREKPEVVAVAADVTVLSNNDTVVTVWGTSIAAPQVAGLAALLVDRYDALQYWPEANRAIIMASATHNIEGPSIIVQGQGDLRDGAGAINADWADQAAQWRGNEWSTCYTSCWWGHMIGSSSPPQGEYLWRTFYADQGDWIRVAINWWSHADTPDNNYIFDRLDTDLDLRIKDPNGNFLLGVESLSFDNNYEMVEFHAPQAGQYSIGVYKYRGDENYNFIGIALVRIAAPYRAYLPAAMKNYP